MPVPNEERQRLWESVRRVSTLERVCEAMSAATAGNRAFHVERWTTGWRWSPAHRGGAYPLLRVVAQYLGIPYQTVLLPFETNASGYAVVPHSKRARSGPQRTTTLKFDGPADEHEVRTRILAALTAPQHGELGEQ